MAIHIYPSAMLPQGIIMDEFIARALVGGIGVALICGPLGCLVVWQRMVYFGAALSHAALFGVALGFFLQINITLSILVVSMAVSCLLIMMTRRKKLSSDTALGILAHSSLAFGILILSVTQSYRLDLMGYLFGEILSITWGDVAWIYLGGSLIGVILHFIWTPLLSLVIQRDMALVDGINETRVKLSFLIMVSIAVAISIQIVGILLIVSLLIIPAAAARPLARSPEQLAILAMIIGTVSVVSGVFASLQLDTPAGPSIVVGATFIFLLTALADTLVSGTKTPRT